MSDPSPSTCDSCGTVEVDLIEVQRVYVTPERWDTPGKVEPAEMEQWCFACRTHYPHVDPTATVDEDREAP